MSIAFTADRFKIWFAIALLALISLGSFWVLQAVRSQGEEAANSAANRTEPDYYVEQFNIVKLSNNGKSNYQIAGDRLSHLPRTDQLEITAPRLESYQANALQMSLHADRAVLSQNSEHIQQKREGDAIELFGNVEAVRPETSKVDYLQFTTEYLLLLPNSDVMKTDKAIQVHTLNTDVQAVGMIADNAKKKLELLSKVRMQFAPPTKTKNVANNKATKTS